MPLTFAALAVVAVFLFNRLVLLPHISDAADRATGRKHTSLALLASGLESVNVALLCFAVAFAAVAGLAFLQARSDLSLAEPVDALTAHAEEWSDIFETWGQRLGIGVGIVAWIATVYLCFRQRYGFTAFADGRRSWERLFGHWGFGAVRGARKVLAWLILVLFALSFITVDAHDVAGSFVFAALRVQLTRSTEPTVLSQLPARSTSRQSDGDSSAAPIAHDLAVDIVRHQITDDLSRQHALLRSYSQWKGDEPPFRGFWDGPRGPAPSSPSGGGSGSTAAPEGSGRPRSSDYADLASRDRPDIAEAIRTVEVELRNCGSSCLHDVSVTLAKERAVHAEAGEAAVDMLADAFSVSDFFGGKHSLTGRLLESLIADPLKDELTHAYERVASGATQRLREFATPPTPPTPVMTPTQAGRKYDAFPPIRLPGASRGLGTLTRGYCTCEEFVNGVKVSETQIPEGAICGYQTCTLGPRRGFP